MPLLILAAIIAALVWAGCEQRLPEEPPARPAESNHSPIASIAGTNQGAEGSSIAFDGRGSSDPDGDSLTYLWAFGDGLPPTRSVTTEHAYADNGTYIATLIVTDLHGAADTASTVVSVSNAPPEISVLATSTTVLAVGAIASIDVTYRDPGFSDSLTASVAWGDGGSNRILGSHADHGYTAAGRYVVTVTVRDNEGATATRIAPAPIVVYDPDANQLQAAGYETIDLGTLGGEVAIPSALNDLGQIVGVSRTADGAQHVFLWDNGAMQDLAPDLPGASAGLITNSGIVVGSIQSTPAKGSLLIWKNGVRTDLGDLGWAGGERSWIRPIAVSEAGDVLAAQFNGERTHSGIWRGGIQEVLGGFGPTPPGVAGIVTASAMNGRGQIVGAGMVGENAGNEIRHAFLWESGVMKELGLIANPPCGVAPEPRCGYASAVDVNNNGDVVGESSVNEKNVHAVLWSGATIRDLGFQHGVAINEAGDIAGYGGGNAFFWRQGVTTTVGSLGGGGTQVVGMNDQSLMMGSSLTSWGGVHVFVWESGKGLMDLGVGPTAFGGDGAQAVAINARGDIIGYTATCFQFGTAEAVTCQPNEHSRAILWRRK